MFRVRFTVNVVGLGVRLALGLIRVIGLRLLVLGLVLGLGF